MEFVDILTAKSVYQMGGNVTQHLREKLKADGNTSKIIEIAYDLQAGSYIEAVNNDRQKAETYALGLSKILQENLAKGDSLLDVGSGELTTLTLVLNNLSNELSEVFAMDLSWSRLAVGTKFHRANNEAGVVLKRFVSDMSEIPLHGKCVDVVTSNHALEPNGEKLESLVRELFRVTKKRLVLFEPSYELNSPIGKGRMREMGYIKDIEGTVTKLGGKLLDVIPLTEVYNPLNPTAAFIIEPSDENSATLETPTFCVPGTDFKLEMDGQVLFSRDTGLVFPILDDIAILKRNSAILATLRC